MIKRQRRNYKGYRLDVFELQEWKLFDKKSLYVQRGFYNEFANRKINSIRAIDPISDNNQPETELQGLPFGRF
jgi:hypothetical protein